ncbi:MAG: hypothetical protein KJ018_11560 [Burkholderiales bacterium]|nr:hypothetical protein [Burkholderiales bacterium]
MPDGEHLDAGLLAALVAAVHRLEAGQREILALLRRPAGDEPELRALVRAIYASVEDATFQAVDLLALSLHRPALAAALGPFVDADADLRSLGKALARARDGAPLEGLAVEGRRRGRVTVWRVRALSHFESETAARGDRAI